MREVVHLTPADARRRPWKNGRGVTEELALWPDGARFERGDFEWRISRSAVTDPGPFSLFAGFERILVVTEGEGLLLTHGDRAPRARLRPFEPYAFSGDWPTLAELPAGAVADFNVLFRRDAVEAEVQVLRLGRRRAREALAASHAFVHVLSGAAIARAADEDEPFELGARDSLWLRAPAVGEDLEVSGASPDCAIVIVRLSSTRSA